MSSSKVVDVKSVNSIYAGLMRSLFEIGFKSLGLWETGYLFIVVRYGDDIFQPEAVQCFPKDFS